MTRRGSHPDAARFERSARFWMRAYPRRWRVVRGEELLGVLGDLAAPGTRRVGVRTAVDLVTGGWATRLREHPPLLPWLGYRTLGRQLPDAYRAWAKDDIDGAWYGARLLVYLRSSFLLYFYGALYWNDMPRPILGFLAAFTIAMVIFTTRGDRRRATEKYVTPRTGERLYGGRLVVQEGAVPRVDARSGLRWLAAASGLLAAGSIAAVGLAPLGTWVYRVPRAPGVDGGFRSGVGPAVDRAPAIVVVLIGVLLAILAVRRVRRLLPQSVDQPNRLLRPIGLLGAVRTVIVTAVGAVPLLLELSGRIVLVVSPVFGAAMLFLFAGSIAGMMELRRSGCSRLAVVDVLQAAVLGRVPEVDEPVAVLGRASESAMYDDVAAFGGPGRSAMPV